MSEPSVQVSRDAVLGVQRVGQEQTPVIVIDGFLVDTQPLIDHACELKGYAPDSTSAYPGVRAKLPRQYVLAVMNSLFRLLFRVFAIPAAFDLRPVNAAYSLISTPEDDLSPAQSVPHYDSNDPYYLALLHYLSPGDFGGTGFFRHRPTGFETVSRERLPRFLSSSEEYQEEHGKPPRHYFRESNDHFELFEQIGYRPNRLVVYPGCLLHSGLVDPDRDVSDDPRTGRLTANLFVSASRTVEDFGEGGGNA